MYVIVHTFVNLLLYIQLYFIHFAVKFIIEGLTILRCIWEILSLSRFSVAGYHE